MIAIEVESPGNTAEELDRKVFAYLKNGAGEVWLVYPRTNSMLVHSSLDQKVIRVTGEYQTTLVPELIVRLQDLLSKRP